MLLLFLNDFLPCSSYSSISSTMGIKLVFILSSFGWGYDTVVFILLLPSEDEMELSLDRSRGEDIFSDLRVNTGFC